MNEQLRSRFTAQFATIANARVRRAISELASNPTIVARELHSLAGEAGMLGLAQIADAAAEASTIAGEWVAKPPSNEDRLACARKLRSLMTLVSKLDVATPAPAEAASPANYSALIVEDSELVAEELADGLRRTGFESRIAATFEAVATALSAHVPDVVLLDANLPGVDVKKVCEHIRQHGRRAKVILVSGVSDQELAQLAGSIGVDGHVSKLHGVANVIEHVVSVVRRGAA